MCEKEIIDLIKSGDFTIAYHDNEYCCLYKGKLKYEDLPEDKEVYEFDNADSEGYIPEVVDFLVKALKGKVLSAETLQYFKPLINSKGADWDDIVHLTDKLQVLPHIAGG